MKRLFTLIEALIVIVILGVLAAIIIPNISNQQKDSIYAMMNTNIRILQTAVDTYALEHNGQFPTEVQPTLEKPSYIDIEKLYPKYIKSKIDYKKVKDQKYWVDAFGKVWGSTVDSPSNLFQSDSFIEWNHKPKIEKYNLYEVENENTTSSLNNKKVKLKYSWDVNKNIERIQIPFSEDKLYLLSSVDEYGLESAPAGIDYTGYQDWFQPLINKEGTFVFSMDSNQIMYWDSFKTIEHKPQGTSISYRFSVQQDNGEYGEWTNDFYSLPPSKSIKVEVTMKGYNGKYPILQDMRIFYHYENEEVLLQSTRPTAINLKEDGKPIDPNLPVTVVDSFVLPQDQQVEDIIVTDSYSPFIQPKVSYSYKAPTKDDFIPISSFSSVPEGSTIQIKREYDKGYDLFVQSPIIKTTDHLNIQKITTEEILSYSPSQKEEWTTVNIQNFFANSVNGQITKWIKAEIDDTQPEFTRILYFYQSGNNGDWSPEFDDITKVPASRSLKIKAVLQVKTEKLHQVDEPRVNKIRIIQENGSAIQLYNNEYGIWVWSDNTMDAQNAFDNDFTTSIDANEKTITWTGDLTNKAIRIKATFKTGTHDKAPAGIQILDSHGNKLPFLNLSTNKFENEYLLIGYLTDGTFDTTIVMPPNAAKIYIYSSLKANLYEIEEVNLSSSVTPVSNVNATPYETKITLTWNVPADSNKVIIYRNGVFAGISTNGTFEDNPLLSDTEYTYRLISVNKDGNIAETEYKTRTLKRAIQWSGLSPEAFDRNYSTSTDGVNKTVTWTGDLTNKAVRIKATFKTGTHDKAPAGIQILDSQGNKLPFLNLSTNKFENEYLLIGYLTDGTFDATIVMPPNAAKIYIYTTWKATVYEIEEVNVSSPVTPVSNINATPYETKISLTWNTPTNIDRVIIYRNGVFAGVSKNGSFEDSPLFSDTEYNYNLISVNKDGNIAQTQYQTRTLKRAIQWSGLDATAFDRNYSTSADGVNKTVTWTGDLANKPVRIKASFTTGSSSSSRAGIQILDAQGNKLSFLNLNTNQTQNEFLIIGYFTSQTIDATIVMPPNAAKIYIYSSWRANVYEIEEQFSN